MEGRTDGRLDVRMGEWIDGMTDVRMNVEMCG